MSDKTIQDLIDRSQADFTDGVNTASPFYKNIFIPSLARDIVLFGKQHGEELIANYGLTAADLAHIIEMPIFKAEIKTLRILMDEGVMVTTQMKAASALEGAVEVLSEQLLREDIRPGEVVKVVQELKNLATMTHMQVWRGGNGGAKGDEVTNSAGMVVNFSFGDPNQLPPIRQPINVTPQQQLDKKEEVVIDADAIFAEVENESV